MKSFISTVLFMFALIGVTYFILAKSDISDEIGNPDKRRRSLSFSDNRNTREDYIAYLRKTIRNNDPELTRRIKAIEDRPVWP